MRHIVSGVLAAVLAAGFGLPARADDKDVTAVLDKAIKALGGEDKLGKAKIATWKAKGKISFGNDENAFTSQVTVQGLDHLRSEFEGEFMGNQVKRVTVLKGDKGWRKFGDQSMELDKAGLANEKRSAYLLIVPGTILPLKDKGFKVEAAGEEKVGGKAAAGIKITGADGKDFKLYFDKGSGLPVKQVAKVVVDSMGKEATLEMTFGSYKDFNGIKKATKIDYKGEGQKFLDQQITEFKVLDKVDPKTFDEPE